MDSGGKRCSNCCAPFKLRPDDKGYVRFSLDRIHPQTGTTARAVLETCLNVRLKDTSSIKTGKSRATRGDKFLCQVCWTNIAHMHKYKNAIEAFCSSTSSESYISKQIDKDGSPCDSPPLKRSRLTSTAPLEIPPSQPTEPDSTQPQQPKSQKLASRLTKCNHSPPEQYNLQNQPRSEKKTKWDRIVQAIQARHYNRAIRGFYKATPGTKKSVIKLVSSVVRREVKSLIKAPLSLCKELNIPNVKQFSWDTALTEVEDAAPILYSSVVAAVTRKGEEEDLLRGQKDLKPLIGNVFGSIFHGKHPRKAKFLQTINSIQLVRGGLKRSTLKQFSRSGHCLGYDDTLKALDYVKRNIDIAAMTEETDEESDGDEECGEDVQSSSEENSNDESDESIEDEDTSADEEDDEDSTQDITNHQGTPNGECNTDLAYALANNHVWLEAVVAMLGNESSASTNSASGSPQTVDCRFIPLEIDVNKERTRSLRRLVSRCVPKNAQNRRDSKWGKASSKPSWWPQNQPFLHPGTRTTKKVNGSMQGAMQFSAADLRDILNAFIDDRKDKISKGFIPLNSADELTSALTTADHAYALTIPKPAAALTTAKPASSPATDEPTSALPNDEPTSVPMTDEPASTQPNDKPASAPTNDEPASSPTAEEPSSTPTTDEPTSTAHSPNDFPAYCKVPPGVKCWSQLRKHTRKVSAKSYAIGRNTFSPVDLATLDDQNCLNDQIIHAYLGVIQSQCHERVFVFPCFLATMWANGDLSACSYEKHLLKTYRFIFLPVCHGQHWFLLVGDTSTKEVSVLDSQHNGIRRNTWAEYWNTYFMVREMKLTVKEGLDKWQLNQTRSKQQSDASSCGVFVLMNAEAVASDALGEVRADMALEYREYIRYRLMATSVSRTTGICQLPWCSLPRGDTVQWIQCDQCDRWCHFVCSGIKEEPATFKCLLCFNGYKIIE